MSFEHWANRTFTHVRDEVGDYGIRMLIHVPVGIFLGLTYPLSHDFLIILKEYQNNECLYTKDQAWKDYAGVLNGIPIGRTIQLTIIGIFLWRLVEWFK